MDINRSQFHFLKGNQPLCKAVAGVPAKTTCPESSKGKKTDKKGLKESFRWKIGLSHAATYRQTSPSTRTLKLSAKNYEPFQVIARLDAVVYNFQLPPTSTIHLVFHLSLLFGY